MNSKIKPDQRLAWSVFICLIIAIIIPGTLDDIIFYIIASIAFIVVIIRLYKLYKKVK